MREGGREQVSEGGREQASEQVGGWAGACIHEFFSELTSTWPYALVQILQMHGASKPHLHLS